MGQFLRLTMIVLLVLIGFGTGICGLFGLAATFPGGVNSIVFGLSIVGFLVTIGCFFGIRTLARRMREASKQESS
jgi:hypothetical protein